MSGEKLPSYYAAPTIYSVDNDQFSPTRLALQAVHNSGLYPPFFHRGFDHKLKQAEENHPVKVEILGDEVIYKPPAAGSVVGSLIEHLKNTSAWDLLEAVENGLAELLLPPEPKASQAEAFILEAMQSFYKSCLVRAYSRRRQLPLSVLWLPQNQRTFVKPRLDNLRAQNIELIESIVAEGIEPVSPILLAAVVEGEIALINPQQLEKIGLTRRRKPTITEVNPLLPQIISLFAERRLKSA